MSHRTNSIDKFVVCPFYNWSSPNRICCEGIMENNTTNLIFGDPSKTREYMHNFCCDSIKYKKCTICMVLYRKYGE